MFVLPNWGKKPTAIKSSDRLAARISGVHRPPEGQGPNGGHNRRCVCVLFPLGYRGYQILSRFFVMLVFLFCKLFEHYSQINFTIIKTTSFKATKYKKVWQIIRPKWVKIKMVVIILSVLLKNESKDTHYKFTHCQKQGDVWGPFVNTMVKLYRQWVIVAP